MLLAIGCFHLGASALYLLHGRHRSTELLLGALAVGYVLIAMRIATRRAIIRPDELVVVGMWRHRVRPGDIRGVVVRANRVVGLDHTGLGRPLVTLRSVKAYEAGVFTRALNDWCRSHQSEWSQTRRTSGTVSRSSPQTPAASPAPWPDWLKPRKE